MTDTLAIEEINILLAALEAWENKDASMDILDIITDNIIKDGPKDMLKQKEQQKAQRVKERDQRKETSIMLKAKLIGMKRALGDYNAFKA